MLLSAIVGSSLLVSAFPLSVWASPAADSNSEGGSFKGRFTYYNPGVGLGSCGKQNSDDSFTVALNEGQYGDGYPGPHCFKEITISYNGKTHDATIMDKCPSASCAFGALDLSPALFKFFAPLDVGVINGEWSFKDGSSGSSSNSTSTASGSSNTSHHSGGGSSTSGSASGSSTGGPSSTTPAGTGPTSSSNQDDCDC